MIETRRTTSSQHIIKHNKFILNVTKEKMCSKIGREGLRLNYGKPKK